MSATYYDPLLKGLGKLGIRFVEQDVKDCDGMVVDMGALVLDMLDMQRCSHWPSGGGQCKMGALGD